MIKAVFDTNVILQAILSEFGPARSCLQFVLQGHVLLITTQETVNELLGVISRPSLLKKVSAVARANGIGVSFRDLR